MPAPTDNVDLARLAVSPGEARRFEIEVRPGGFEYGGQRYNPPDESIAATLDVTRTAAGHSLRLRFETPVLGPCVRCLEPGGVRVSVDAREIDQMASEADELLSPYVSEDVLDVAGWAHDALALAMPETFLCRAGCAGLCPVCGASLNDVDPAEHRHEAEPDPRWAKLRELQ